MLRSLVLILLIVNATFFAWSRGWLSEWVGVRPDAQHEPQRLAQQLHAERIMVIPSSQPEPPARRKPTDDAASTAATAASVPGLASSAASASATAPTTASATGTATASTAAPAASLVTTSAPRAAEATLCIEAGPFNSEDASAADRAMRAAALPATAWTRQSVVVGGQWMVYMGPYPDDDLYARKLTELRRIKNLNFDEVRSPASLAQGFSLGRFPSEADAEARLASLRQRGIRTARVVTLRPPGQVQYLRVPKATVRMQVTLSGLKLPQGKSFTACRS